MIFLAASLNMYQWAVLMGNEDHGVRAGGGGGLGCGV